MSDTSRPSVWQMVREAAVALSGATTNIAVRDWILNRYPGTNENTINAQIVVCTVNNPSRVNFPQNKKPRLANSPQDFLFRTGKGRLALYESDKHGQWAIEVDDAGKPRVVEVGEFHRSGESLTGEPQPTAEGASAFAAEAHLRDYLVLHLEVIEPGLALYTDADGNGGVELITPVGRIDILAVDRDDRLVVIELKVSRGSDAVAGQILKYMNWVKRNLADGGEVRGVIVAKHVSEKLLYSLADRTDVQLFEYEISMNLAAVPPLA